MEYSYFDVMKTRRNASAGMNPEQIQGRFPAETPLAMAYVPYQTFNTVYEADTALDRGTLFPELNLPLASEEDMKYE